MMRLMEGLYTWSVFDQERRCNFNGFLIAGEGRCVVVDPPPFSDDDLAYFESLTLWPDTLLLTNRNHARACSWWQGRRPTPTAMHRAEAGQVDFKPDALLEEGDLVGPGLRVVHLPGKSPGEIGLFWPERRLLLLGDALVAPSGRLKTVPDAKIDDKTTLRASLRKLAALDFDALLLADGDPILRGGKAAVEAFLAAS